MLPANLLQTPQASEGIMPVVNHVPRLVKEKRFNGGEVNMSTVATETGLNYITVQKWLKAQVNRADFDVLIVWCNYLDCAIGDLLEYKP